MRFGKHELNRSLGREGGPVIAPRPGVKDRIAARLRSRSLDIALADGIPPEMNAAVALRARHLVDPCERKSLADSLRRMVREAREGPRRSRVRIQACWNRVAAAGDELDELADALARPGPVSPHGVAEALLLLTDGTGPVYNPESRANLRTLAAEARADLRL